MAGLIVFIFVSFVICAYAVWRSQSRRFNEPPMYPGAWPLIGHVPSLIGRKNLYSYLRQAALDLPYREGITYILVGLKKIYVICDPDDSLLVSNQCLDKSVYYNFGETWTGESLLNSASSIWKKDRKMLLPAFHHRVLEGFLETFNREARRTVEKLSPISDKGTIDILPYINEYAMDTLCDTVLGVNIPDKKKYIHTAETLMSIFLKRFLNVFLHSDTIYNWSSLKRIEDKYINFFHSVADKVIEKKKSEKKVKPQNNKRTRSNFLELMLETSTREAMTDKQLRDHLNFMIIAGFDTISLTTTIILLTIGSHKTVQDKIYKEIIEVLGETYEDNKPSDLDRLVYLEAVIKESMRLYPATPLVLREIKEDIKIANYTLYAGTSCALFLAGLNMHPIWGEDAQKFNPERWLQPSTVPDHPAAFAGFSIGRRNCIGKYYAMMSMKTLLVHILRNYVVKADLAKVEFGFELLTKPEPGNHISVEKRI